MSTKSLLTETPGSELHATWEALQAGGIGRTHLKKIRSNPDVVEKIAKLLKVRERRTTYTYPPEYQPSSIAEQIKKLQTIPEFSELDAAWALNEAQAWYDSLDLPEWVENPLVKVWDESVGGYHTALGIVLSAIAREREFYNYREGQFTPKLLRQNEATHEAELKLKSEQPGDFLILPAQMGDRWGGYSVDEVSKSYNEGEFGVGLLAGASGVYTQPNRLFRWEQLHMDLPGDEFDDPVAEGRFDHVPYLRFPGVGVGAGTGSRGDVDAYFGSVSAFVPQYPES